MRSSAFSTPAADRPTSFARSFARTFIGTVVRPVPTLRGLQRHPHALATGLTALLVVTLVYTFILAAFIARGYPAAAPSALPVAPEQQYRYQVWFQGPLFLLATLVLGAAVAALARWRKVDVGYAAAFAQASLATVVPFFFTTMLIEFALAVLLLAGALRAREVLRWLTGEGAWFPALYQAVAIVWLVALLAVVVRVDTRLGWLACAGLAVALGALYALPIGLFIR